MKYNEGDIEKLLSEFENKCGLKIEFSNELSIENRAKVKSYFAEINPDIFLKIDFIEDVFFKTPLIRRIDNIPVYDIEHIYYLKLMAVAGVSLSHDETGRERHTGRNAEKDVYDLYCLSRKFMPLHQFLKKMPGEQQRGMTVWYRSFSRQELKINIMDLEIYEKKFDSGRMIKYLDDEIRKFIGEII